MVPLKVLLVSTCQPVNVSTVFVDSQPATISDTSARSPFANGQNPNAPATGPEPTPSAGSGRALKLSKIETATLEVVPGRSVPLVVKLAEMPVGVPMTATCADLPADVTCSYDDNNQTMTITPATSTPPGNYPIRVVFNTEEQK